LPICDSILPLSATDVDAAKANQHYSAGKLFGAFAGQKIACRNNHEWRIRQARLKLRTVVDEQWRGSRHAFDPGRTGIGRFLAYRRTGLCQFCQLERECRT
jgi:hypothetical protein